MNGAWNHEKVAVFRDSFYEFINHVTISSKERGKMVLGASLYRAQVMFYETIFEGLAEDCHDFYCLKSRQLGISSGIRPLSLFWLGMHEGLRGAMVFDSAFNSTSARREIEQTLDSLPKKLHFPGIRSRNRDALILENDSWLLFMQAGTRNSRSGGGLGRSLGLNFVHASELSSWASEEGVTSFRQSLSEGDPNRLFLWESTARGYELWYRLWEQAKLDPIRKRTLFIGWWAKDNQIIRRDTAEFSIYGAEPPNGKEQERIRLVSELYNWEITPEQLAWYRWKTDPGRELDDGDPEDSTVIQEQPWCLVRGTLVGTDRGIIPIEEAPLAKFGTLGSIVAGGKTREAEIWQITTHLGYELSGTADHPIIDNSNNEIRLCEAEGATIRLQPPRFASDEHTVSWREPPVLCEVVITPSVARLVGIYMGDGSVTSGGDAHSINISCDAKDDDFVDECCRLFEDIFEKKANITRYDPNETGGWVNVRLSSKSAVRVFKRLGLTRNDTGKTMRHIHVPSFIWRSPKNVVKEFLSGLFETDGFNAYETNRCVLFSKYPDFLRDIQILLLGFGITSRRRTTVKRAGDGHAYTGCELQLRSAEAKRFNEEIGFLSNRKKARANKPALRGPSSQKPIVMEDKVVESVKTDKVEEVFNITIDGSHLFDANGILTHNCEEEAFQSTGSSFFQSDKLSSAASRLAEVPKPQSFRFWPNLDFVTSDMRLATMKREVEFRMWEEPCTDSWYVVSADPAFGHDENNNNSAAQVLRCYADYVEQVGEYTSASIQPHQFAWLLWTLIGYYGSMPNSRVLFILELNGPGEEVWRQFQATQQIVQFGYQKQLAREKGISNIFSNVQRYIYNRSDSMVSGSSWQWKTSGQNKVQIMEAVRNYLHNGVLIVNSMESVEEMRTITRDGDTIGAENHNRDDRVFALALGVRAWDEKIRRPMIAGNRTREAERAKSSMTIDDQWALFQRNHLQNFLKTNETTRARSQAVAARASWRAGIMARRPMGARR